MSSLLSSTASSLLSSTTSSTEALAAFHLAPTFDAEDITNYSTIEERKYFERCTAKLSEDPFDAEETDRMIFTEALIDRSKEIGWDIDGIGITSIYLNPYDSDSEYVNILINHGELTLEQIRAFEESHIHMSNRAAQDTCNLCRCLMRSISNAGMKKLAVWKDQYTIGNRSSGNLLWKVIVRECGLDTKTTTAFLRRSLINLNEYMSRVQDNILKFNMHVKQCVHSLKERGESSSDLLIKISKRYLLCKNKTFVKYVQQMLDLDKDDSFGTLTPDTLMLKGANKYKILKQNGKWKEPSQVE